MNPTDKRILEQLERWLTSIELHLKYVDLDEAGYRRVQQWPEHERPNRWILEIAQQKILQLRTLCKAHVSNKDDSFAEGLELMAFLANLVGAQNLKRFIPLADPSREQLPAAPAPVAPRDENATREMPKLQPTPRPEPEATRELPKLKTAVKKTAPPPRAEPVKRANPKPPTAPQDVSARMDEVVVADAVRLLKWGKQWHELTELIARMAERPAPAEIRRILRSHKAAIEAQLINK